MNTAFRHAILMKCITSNLSSPIPFCGDHLAPIQSKISLQILKNIVVLVLRAIFSSIKLFGLRLNTFLKQKHKIFVEILLHSRTLNPYSEFTNNDQKVQKLRQSVHPQVQRELIPIILWQNFSVMYSFSSEYLPLTFSNFRHSNLSSHFPSAPFTIKSLLRQSIPDHLLRLALMVVWSYSSKIFLIRLQLIYYVFSMASGLQAWSSNFGNYITLYSLISSTFISLHSDQLLYPLFYAILLNTLSRYVLIKF